MARINKFILTSIAILLLLCNADSLVAQSLQSQSFRPRQQGAARRPNTPKRFDAIKKGYIARQLSLSGEQSARFWPIYDDYQAELDDILALRKQNSANVQPNGADQFDREMEYQQRITSTQKHYYNEFLKVLPADKAAQVFKCERDFKFELLRRLKEGGQPYEGN